MAAVIKNGNEIKLGADPEFILVPLSGDGEPCSIHESWTGIAGNYSRDNGSSSTGELRPAPGSPREVTENIRTIIKQIHNSYRSHKLIVGGGGSFQKYIGGHIHFNIADSSQLKTVPRNMAKALDFFIGRNLKHMVGGNRYGNHYGADGDCREKTHGFEYRTAPSFIVDPTLTEAVFAIAYRIAELALEGSAIINVSETGRASALNYDMLVPVGTPFESYYSNQFKNFRDYVFGGFILSTDDAFDRWLSPIPFEFKAGQDHVNVRGIKERLDDARRQAAIEAENRANAERDARALAASQAILGCITRATPVRCRIEHSYSIGHPIINSELLTHSVIGNVKIHQGYPWDARLSMNRIPRTNSYRRNRSIRIDSSIVYLSSDLKGKFKIPRDAGFKVKYANITSSQTNTPVSAIVSCSRDISVADIVEKILRNTKRAAQVEARA